MTLPPRGRAGAGDPAAACPGGRVPGPAWGLVRKEMEKFGPKKCPLFPSLAPELSVPVWFGLCRWLEFGFAFLYAVTRNLHGHGPLARIIKAKSLVLKIF